MVHVKVSGPQVPMAEVPYIHRQCSRETLCTACSTRNYQRQTPFAASRHEELHIRPIQGPWITFINQTQPEVTTSNIKNTEHNATSMCSRATVAFSGSVENRSAFYSACVTCYAPSSD